MSIFMIERQFAEQLEAGSEVIDALHRVNDEEGIRWLYSFLSQDLRKTYCLYEAPNADAIRAAASRLGIPADAIIELTGRLENDGSVTPIG